MNRTFRGLCLLVAVAMIPEVGRGQAVPYGANAQVGKTFVHDGVKLYYEVYGAGEPLVVIHPNGTSIAAMKPQIEHFRKKYRVIAMDTRDHGKSADSTGKLTYEAMAGDVAALLDVLKVGPVNVVGWSDGAIQALLLGMKYPAKVKKIAATGANLNPTTAALYPETIAWAKEALAGVPAADRATPQGKRAMRTTQLMLDEPRIDAKLLESIKAPTLIMAGDHDLIRDEHTVELFHRIPNSELAIFPGAVHSISWDNPALFNATVERFFTAPFVKRDRLKDTLKSFEAITAAK